MIEYSKNRTDWIFQFAEAGKINYCVILPQNKSDAIFGIYVGV
jgi:hypothetical protein